MSDLPKPVHAVVHAQWSYFVDADSQRVIESLDRESLATVIVAREGHARILVAPDITCADGGEWIDVYVLPTQTIEDGKHRLRCVWMFADDALEVHAVTGPVRLMSTLRRAALRRAISDFVNAQPSITAINNLMQVAQGSAIALASAGESTRTDQEIMREAERMCLAINDLAHAGYTPGEVRACVSSLLDSHDAWARSTR